MPDLWQKISDDHYVRPEVGGLLRDRHTGQWYWFPCDFDIPKQGPYRDLTSAKHNATRGSRKVGSRKPAGIDADTDPRPGGGLGSEVIG